MHKRPGLHLTNMFAKFGPLVFAAFIAPSLGQVWDGFRASWDLDHSTHFYSLPQSLEAATEGGWTDISGVDQPEGIRALGYYDDPTFVLLFDCDNGEAVGCQFGFPVATVADSQQPILYAENAAISQKMLNGIDYFTSTVYFYHDEENNDRRIWIQNYGNFVEVPTNGTQLDSETNFGRKNCIPAMGVHYYDLYPTSDCAYENPFFFLERDDYIIGFGFQGFGNVSVPIGVRTWWEDIPPGALAYAAPDAPECAINAPDIYGGISLHVWFVDDAANITCDS